MSRGTRIKRKRERKQRKRKEKMQRHRERSQRWDPSGYGWPGQDDPFKLSARLLDIAEPFRDFLTDEVTAQNILNMAAEAWNLALLAEDERADALGATLERNCEYDAEMREFACVVLQTMIERKRELFPHDERPVLGVHCACDDDDLKVQVLSAIMPASCAVPA